jgi:hypothetical protein
MGAQAGKEGVMSTATEEEEAQWLTSELEKRVERLVDRVAAMCKSDDLGHYRIKELLYLELGRICWESASSCRAVHKTINSVLRSFENSLNQKGASK